MRMNSKMKIDSEAKTAQQKAVDNSVKMIALARKVCEMAGEDVEEFDRELNELCNKWHDKFSKMSTVDLANFMVTDLINSALDIEGE